MKTGATSTLKALTPFGDDFQDRKHATLAEQLLEVENPQDYFKFAFIRNPWDKVVSHYFFNHYLYFIRDIPFKDYITKLYEGKPITTAISPTHLPFMRNIKGEYDIDFVGRFENIQEDFDYICDKVGIAKMKLPHKNKTRHNHYSTYYDEESRDMIAEVFKQDIERFGFEFRKETFGS